MVDLDGVASFDARTGFAVRTEPGHSQLADEARVAERIAEPDDLVIEGRRPDVRIVDEARGQVRLERLEWIGAEPARTPGTRSPLM